MSGRLFISLLATVLLSTVAAALAQQPKKIPQIGYLSLATPAGTSFRTEPFRQGLKELGYVEGKDLVIVYRYAAGKRDRLPALAAELVRLKVDIIVSAGPANTQILKNTKTTIPIVMTQDSDPIGNGYISSLARPGGNITGLTTLSAELSGKRLEILNEVVPKLARVAVFVFPHAGRDQALKEAQTSAKAIGLQIQPIDVRGQGDIEGAFRAARDGRTDAVLVLNSPPFIETAIAEFAPKARLPAIYFNSAIVADGGLMSYGASLADLDRRAATYVDKILKGAKPADLPVEQPTKFELVINLKAAKQIGLTIPQWTLMKADRVIR